MPARTDPQVKVQRETPGFPLNRTRFTTTLPSVSLRAWLARLPRLCPQTHGPVVASLVLVSTVLTV
jgi:hypothetical protein